MKNKILFKLLYYYPLYSLIDFLIDRSILYYKQFLVVN